MHYEYARVKLGKNNYAPNADMEGRRDIVGRAAAGGKRHMGRFPVAQGPTGKTVELDLIFEVA